MDPPGTVVHHGELSCLWKLFLETRLIGVGLGDPSGSRSESRGGHSQGGHSQWGVRLPRLTRVSLSVPMETAPAALCSFSCSGKASEGEWLPHLPVALEELVVPISLWLTWLPAPFHVAEQPVQVTLFFPACWFHLIWSLLDHIMADTPPRQVLWGNATCGTQQPLLWDLPCNLSQPALNSFSCWLTCSALCSFVSLLS